VGTRKEKENRGRGTESDKEMKAEIGMCDANEIWRRKIGEISVWNAGLTIERWRDAVQSLFPNTLGLTRRKIGINIQRRTCSDHSPRLEITRDTSSTALSSSRWLPRRIDWGVPGPMGGRPDA